LPQSGQRDHRPDRDTFRTHYENAGFEAPLPTDLFVEGQGVAADLNTAVESFVNGARELAAILAVATNASMGTVEMDVAYDATPGANEREFFQEYRPEQPVTAVSGRRVNVTATLALIAAVMKHGRADRLRRAVAQYSHALEQWSPGAEAVCLGHLFMGMEALKPLALDYQCQKKGITMEQLAAEWGFKEGRGHQTLNQFLDAEARKRLLFRGNEDCHRSAKKASDDFEHGLANFGTIRKVARGVVVTTAGYLRQAIFELAGLGEEHSNIFLTAPFTGARGPLKMIKYLRGHLLAETEKLAADGEDHPRFRWTSKLDSVFLNEGKIYSFKPNETMTASLAEKAQFRPKSVEVWDGSSLREVPF
jgi:hypothetical protein